MSSELRSTCKAGGHSNGRDDLERDHHKHKQVHSSELLDDKIMGTIVGVENVATQTELTGKDMQEREMALIWLEKALSHLQEIPDDAERLVAMKQYGILGKQAVAD